jgi:hypothetical protein
MSRGDHGNVDTLHLLDELVSDNSVNIRTYIEPAPRRLIHHGKLLMSPFDGKFR